MYTRCPTCSTCFRVTARHLAIAKGKVRCGQCQLVFNATENAIDDLPVQTVPSATKAAITRVKKPLKPAVDKKSAKPAAVKTPTKPVVKKPAKPAATKKLIKPVVKKPAKPAATKKPIKPVVKKPVRKAATPKHDANATLITDSASLNKDENLFDDNFDLDAAIDELTQATEDAKDIIGIKEEPKITKSKTYIPTEDNDGDIFNTDAYEATNASSVTDIMEEMEAQLTLDINKPSDIEEPVEDKTEYNIDDEFDFIDLDNETEIKTDAGTYTEFENIKNDEPHDKKTEKVEHFDINEDVKENNVDEDELFDHVDLSDFQVSEDQEDIIVDDPDLDKDEDTIVVKVPLQLRNDIERLQASPEKRWHPLIGLSLFMFLLLLSFSQLAYFRAYELVNFIPATRPALETFCGKVGCQYSGPRNIKYTQILSRDVRQHPKEKKALLISLIMINNAHFAQPYPDIHIRLSDISGTVVGERIFNAKSYMGKLSNPFLLMKSKTPVHINFEVVDPGIYPVNFEFTFL